MIIESQPSIKYSIAFFCLSFWAIIFSPFVFAQNQDQNASSEYQEVYLSFRYQGIINSVVTAYYDSDSQSFYLPVSNLLSQLEIKQEVHVNNLSITGWFEDPDYTYAINFSNNTAHYRGKQLSFKPSDKLVKETDFYLKPAIFEQLLGLHFTIDFNNLSLNLETDHTLPVVSRYEREQQRSRMMQNQPSYQRSYYKLQYDRNRHWLKGGFMDYTLSANVSPSQNNIYTYNTAIGTELLGGDLQGNIFGSWSHDYTNFLTNNLRWRYVMRNNDWLREVQVGQSASNGLSRRSFTGVHVSNEPIQPRYLFDQYVVDGTTIPQSDVELYLNNTLVDFQESDELGNYRFLIPLTYGSSQLQLKIYGPNGQVRTLDRRIQVPFTFLKPGQVNYNANVGQLDNPLLGSTTRNYMAQGDVGAGLTNWLTGKMGFEYYDTPSFTRPFMYSSLSARVFTQYLVNMDLAPDAYYKINTNVVYGSAGSWGLGYTYYTTDNRFYNQTGADQDIQANVFFPVNIGPLPLNFRVLGTRQLRTGADLSRYQFDINSRISRVNIRLGYRDSQYGPIRFEPSQASRMTGSLTYTISRTPGVPEYLKGTFLRSQLTYNPNQQQVEQLDMQLSRDLFNRGQMQVSFGHNFVGNFNQISFNLTIDFNRTRTTTTYRNTRSSGSLTQTVRGSVGFDSNENRFVFNNRQQVGQAAAAVRLFVDNNNNGTYDKGDDAINDEAIRLDRASGNMISEDGITYLTQLQSYNRYNLEINEAAIKNPLLVPEKDKFSFVTDPDNFKTIQIPFYQSGVVSGSAQRLQNGKKNPLGGLRIILQQTDGNFMKKIQSFSDGSFYTMKVPPGNYKAYVDSTQLDFLNANSKPAVHNFDVQANAQGDFVENLDFLLVPRDSTQAQAAQIDTSETQNSVSKSTAQTPKCGYSIQIASFSNLQEILPIADRADSVMKDVFKIKYGKLYTVISEPQSSLQKALILLHNVQQDIMPGAIIVNACRNDYYDNLGYFIQVGAYSTAERARRFTEQAATQLNEKLVIQREDGSKLFFVQTEKFESWKTAFRLLKKIRNKPAFVDAFVRVQNLTPKSDMSHNFSLLLAIKDTKKQAEDFVKAVRSKIPDESKIELQKISNETSFKIEYGPFKGWKNITKLKQQLNNAAEGSYPVIIMNILD